MTSPILADLEAIETLVAGGFPRKDATAVVQELAEAREMVVAEVRADMVSRVNAAVDCGQEGNSAWFVTASRLREELGSAQAEIERLRAEIDRISPVVDAATGLVDNWRDDKAEEIGGGKIENAVDAYRAARGEK